MFARPYNGIEVNFKDVKSIFDFSYLPEKNIFEFLSLIGIDNGYIKSIKNLIDDRNEIAHATGKIQINSEEQFNEALGQIMSVIKNIHEKLSLTIIKSYKKILINYAKKELPNNYETPLDFITDEFIDNMSFSKKDLGICKNFGLNKLKDKKCPGLSDEEIAKIVEFHKSVKKTIY
jgi:hypothetical protein